MCTEKTKVFRAFLTPVIVSLVLIIAADAFGQLDVHLIHFTTSKSYSAGRSDIMPYGLWAMVLGDGINSVQVTSPTNITAVGELGELFGGGWGWFIDLAEDYATLRWLRRDFPIGYYKFTFNKDQIDEDSVMVYTNPAPPTGLANITYPANKAINVPVTPTFTWDSCLGYGDSLFVSIEDEEAEVWLNMSSLNIGETSWTPGPLLPGRLHDFEVCVQTGSLWGQTLSTYNGDPLIYFDVFEYNNEVLFTVVSVAKEKLVQTLEFFDVSVADDTLEGVGSGALAEYQLDALRNMLETASDFIDYGFHGAARRHLRDAYRRCDGLSYPADFVTGPAAPGLAAMILDVIDNLPE